MRPTRVATAGLLLLALVLAAAPNLAAAQGTSPGQAGLVVQLGDGRTLTRCVDLAGAKVSGADLLTNSGLEVSLASSGLGVTVCRIEGLGCAYPAEPCFCHCLGGGDCRYWNYYTRDPGQAGWAYSAQGALLRQVWPGSVDAWVWGDGHTPPSPELTFERVCPPPTPGPSPADTSTPQVTMASAAGGGAAPPAPSPPTVWPFGLMLLALIAIGLLAWYRLK